MEFLESLAFFDPYEILLLALGLAILAATYLPRFLSTFPISMPMVVLALGLFTSFFSLNLDPGFMYSQTKLMEHVTELAVIIALMEAGLKIDRLFDWKSWRIPWRLLGVTMPLTILFVWIAGWWAGGLVSSTALLLGSVIAPSDPVLASDIQVGGPNQGAKDEETGKEESEAKKEEDEVRFSLTSEAGLNDGLAFPFTYLAIFIAASGFSQELVWSWLGTHVIFKIGVGIAIGYLGGRVAGRYFLNTSAYSHQSKAISGLASLALTLIIYGLTELVAGYGFIAVFVGALTLRQFDPDHFQHSHLHGFIEKTQRVFTASMILILGIIVGQGILAEVTIEEILITIVIVFIIRPVAGIFGLIGAKLPKMEKWAISFLGLRGIGSLYYFYYAINQQEFEGQNSVLNIILLTILFSIVIHGILAPLIIKRLEKSKSSLQS
ncbi:cation:proton antiporter [Algoriphagus litoralis]|uniref:cation:proton antiporter n=1 Tax=Algoriphagus litoralis TaxID=2202829 RepID=UPI000DBA9E35|nr:cation:proton antiporter [Algoriphagus litoralis]